MNSLWDKNNPLYRKELYDTLIEIRSGKLGVWQLTEEESMLTDEELEFIAQYEAELRAGT